MFRQPKAYLPARHVECKGALFYRRVSCEGYGAVASILPFLKPGDGSFDDYATRVMGEAFDDARKKLHSAGQPHIVFETIAARIIAAAGRGERDPVRLRNAGLAGLTPDRD
jgi:hypothetical protein